MVGEQPERLWGDAKPPVARRGGSRAVPDPSDHCSGARESTGRELAVDKLGPYLDTSPASHADPSNSDTGGHVPSDPGTASGTSRINSEAVGPVANDGRGPVGQRKGQPSNRRGAAATAAGQFPNREPLEQLSRKSCHGAHAEGRDPEGQGFRSRNSNIGKTPGQGACRSDLESGSELPLGLV